MTRLAHNYINGDWDFNDLYDSGEWEPETLDVLRRFLHRGDTFIDVGAWIGPITVWACELGARVIALEPDPVARRDLTANTLGMDVTILSAALSDTMGTARLGTGHAELGDSTSRLADEGVEVQCVTPEWLIAQAPNASLLKLDIEGGEIDVLPCLMPLCFHWKIPVFVSWHEPWWTHEVDRAHWFDGFKLEAVRGDGWTGWSEMLAVPK